jgi:hypothetical protein
MLDVPATGLNPSVPNSVPRSKELRSCCRMVGRSAPTRAGSIRRSPKQICIPIGSLRFRLVRCTKRERENRKFTMEKIEVSEDIDPQRRHLCAIAAISTAAAQFGPTVSAQGETRPSERPNIKLGMHTSFTALELINAGVLNAGYAEAGPGDDSTLLG